MQNIFNIQIEDINVDTSVVNQIYCIKLSLMNPDVKNIDKFMSKNEWDDR